jgi:asparagine synthase (glutamine-hydrolysing)
MCGILAALGLVAGAAQHRATALAQARKLRHRGPDWSGIYAKGHNIMCHERLAIVDPTSGAQPLYSKDQQVVLAVNGEIYNHSKVADEESIDSAAFQTHSDCEVILHLYQKYGDASFLAKLNGMFAFVLYDEAHDRYIIARDHMGIIPLYIGHGKDGSVWVASELKALIDVCPKFREFRPGHVLVVEGTQAIRHDDMSLFQETPWYNPIWHDEKFVPSAALDIDALRTSFEKAVVRQLMCDVPYGVLLSGGLDSSIVAAIVARHAAKRVEDDEKSDAWYPRVHSFSIGLKGSPDLAAAQKVADFLGTVHHSFEFTVQEGLDALSDVIWHLETYDTTTVRASTPMYLMSRKVKALGIKMVLSGEGSDEIFGGYLYFHKAPNKEEFHLETVRKLKGLHQFDCLRANKSMSSFGVEARVPFLDPEFMQMAMTFDPTEKMITDKRMEKWALRKAFEGYIPDEICWRQKEQFSDGVGYSWIDTLRDEAAKLVSDAAFDARKHTFPVNPPSSKEQYWYRMMFEKHFPGTEAASCVPGGPSIACSTATAIAWDESFAGRADPSGRAVLGVHEKHYEPTDHSSEA